MGRSNDTSFAAFISPAMGPDGVPTGLDPFSAELGKNTGDADLSGVDIGDGVKAYSRELDGLHLLVANSGSSVVFALASQPSAAEALLLSALPK